MPLLLLKLLKNPAFIKWTIIISVMVGLFFYGKIQYIRVENLKKDVIIASENINKLESANLAIQENLKNIKNDIKLKNDIVDELSKSKNSLEMKYNILHNSIKDLATIISTTADEDLPQLTKELNEKVKLSYDCIEKASKGESCE